MKMVSYSFRILSLAFWIVVVVGLSKLFGDALSWVGCVISIFYLWLFTLLARIYGIKILPKIFKLALGNFIKSLPFFLLVQATGMALIVIGAYHSSKVLVLIGLVINFVNVFVISWPRLEWYSPIVKKVRRTKK